MNPQDSLQQIVSKMQADGFSVSTELLPIGSVLIGYKSQFKIRWVATKLHLFMAVMLVPQASADLLVSFDTQVAEYANQKKGGLRGLQNGVAIIPALVSTNIDEATRNAATQRPKKHFAEIDYPAVIDLAANCTYVYGGKLIWGAIYKSWLLQRIAAVFPPISS